MVKVLAPTDVLPDRGQRSVSPRLMLAVGKKPAPYPKALPTSLAPVPQPNPKAPNAVMTTTQR
jgi:hypothetical protein